MKVKQEKLEWLADNPFYSKRFAFFDGHVEAVSQFHAQAGACARGRHFVR
jgi:hypothetical protein